MYRQVPGFQITVGPTPSVTRVIPISSAPVIMSTILHDLRCHRCELFSNVVSEIESSLESVDTSNGEKDEIKYVVSLAKKISKHGKLIYSDQSTKMTRGWMCEGHWTLTLYF